MKKKPAGGLIIFAFTFSALFLSTGDFFSAAASSLFSPGVNV